jgi:RNA-binding protein YlmH
MENRELKNRIDDLAERAGRRGTVTKTDFLTPAEQYALRQYTRSDRLVLFGGQPDCERQAAFFLPEYMDPEDFDPAEYIRAVKLTAHFGTPGHRDYLGAVLGLGITREALGDIRIEGDTAYIFCLPAVQKLLLDELCKVGRVSVTVEACALSDVPAPVLKVRPVSFTVKSLRFDAVTGSVFGMSRTAAADAIRQGLASLNYSVCDRTDAPVKEGDILSLKGHGKARVKAVGGRSKKDRLFVDAEVFV